jgi:hypothetical protein
MIEVVNGYLCLSSCDVTAAEQGKNPAHPNAAPGQSDATGAASQAGAKDKTSATAQTDPSATSASANSSWSQSAVVLSGVFSQTTSAASSSNTTAQANTPYQPGSVFSLSA